jgi:hypothetical protein
VDLMVGLWQSAAHTLLVPSLPTMLTAAVLAMLLVAVAVTPAATPRPLASLPVIRRVAALREKSWNVAFLRQRDPDAAGRARPRAPSAAPAAA